MCVWVVIAVDSRFTEENMDQKKEGLSDEQLKKIIGGANGDVEPLVDQRWKDHPIWKGGY